MKKQNDPLSEWWAGPRPASPRLITAGLAVLIILAGALGFTIAPRSVDAESHHRYARHR